jgi:hypothetical protein
MRSVVCFTRVRTTAEAPDNGANANTTTTSHGYKTKVLIWVRVVEVV